jgi:hypothetical protein
MPTATYLDQLPPDVVHAVAHAAARDAVRTVLFLDALGLRPPPGQVLPLPAGFLLDLGAALRLLIWSQAGINPRHVAGLPPAQEALRDVLLSLRQPPAGAAQAEAPGTLARRVMAAFVEHFAWCGPIELDADLTLGAADEEAVLEALADFLWAHRPR